ncbi:MAG: DUF445 family protein [Sedimentibacter sp.]
MNEIILNYIVQAILGGASGYITNDYAINMLFKEYTPLKIGGVIKKTRHEFIENLSSMVENDIIDKEKLQNILSDENFKKKFENMTADFYENCLYEAVGSHTFGHIGGFDSTIKSTDIFTVQLINEHMPELYELIVENISLADFFNEAQLLKISNALYDTLTEIIKKTDIADGMLLSLVKSNDKAVLGNILGSDISNTVLSNTVDLFTKAILSSDTEKLEELLYSLNFKKTLNSYKEVLSNKKVKEIINLDIQVVDSINQVLLNYINSEKGNHLINSLTNSLFAYGKECNKSVFQLLDSSFEENLKLYLIKNIPSVTENVVSWIKLNSYLIDKIIEESIDEVIKESDGLKAKLLTVIKNSYYKDLSKKFSIANKIITYVKKISEPEKLSDSISAKLIEILNKLTVRELIFEAEKNYITPENSRKLIINYINKNSLSIINNTINYISELEIKKILSLINVDEELKTTLLNKLKNLVASDSVKKFIINKATEYTDTILSKELRDLLDDEKEKFVVSKLKNLVASSLQKNENSIKAWIVKEAAAVLKANSAIKLNENRAKELNDSLYKYYKKAAEDINDVNLSTALDKINSIDNVVKNSSESLRTYAVKNADVILSGSIEAIARDNLNKLNDNQLVDLANDFIGRELKPIMYFGGVLGIAAGLILAALQNTALDPAKINAANMAVYALVGYVTNVVAINMIFKPYKENRLLSKIPFLRNFSLGYIVKNQKIFAKSTAYFIDNRLLSKESIHELFDKYKDKIKYSFTKTIADNDYKTLSNLLFNNKQSTAKGVYAFLKVQLSQNIKNISAYIYNKISRVNVSALINSKAINKINLLLREKMQNSAGLGIKSLILSDSSLESKISGNVIKKYMTKMESKIINKLCQLLSQKSEWNNFILRNEDSYQGYINKTINEIIDTKKREAIAQSASEKISSVVLSKASRDKITQRAVSLINKFIDKDKSFGEIFNGKLKKYVDSQIPDLLEKLTSYLVNSLKESKLKISLMVQSEIKNQLGFIEKSMYSVMGGDELIDELLTKIIMVKIPSFLDDKKLELNSIANMLLQDKFYNSKVEVLYTGINKLQLNELVDSYFSSGNSLKIENKINITMKDLFEKAENIKLSSILKLFYADNLELFLNAHNEEINAIANELALNLSENKSHVMEKLSTYTDSLLDIFMQSKFNELFAGISDEQAQHVQDNIITEIYVNGFEDIINASINSCISHYDKSAGEFIDKDEFIKAVENSLLSLAENTKLKEAIKEHIEAVIDEAAQVNFSFIDKETKNHFLNIFTDSCIDSLKINLDEILKSIEFDKIAQEEIEKMEPRKIHEMFDSFAGKYFKRLMLYGFGGFVFGINMYVGFSLTTLKILSELLNNTKLKLED